MSDRARSASPAREPKPKKQKTTGFKWKEKKPATASDFTSDAREPSHLSRGYRDRSPRRDRDRDSYRNQDGNRNTTHSSRDNNAPQRARDRSPPRGGEGGDRHLAAPSAATTTTSTTSSSRAPPTQDPTQPSEPKAKKKKKPKPPVSNEPMIIVNINDRLGTKAAIPCLASDSIKAFKAIVAANIGRQPHEIMLKRQGERPFKDALTLEDYGVSNGVQLDLEVDTGD